jgi:rhodanese-related sulfurtransferase
VAPVLEELSKEYAEELTIAKVDVDQCPKVANTYRIQSIPTLMLFKNGEPAEAAQGALPKPALVRTLEGWLPQLAGPLIEVAELAEALEKRAPHRLIDLRREQDFQRSHLRSSECVPAEKLEELMREVDEAESVVLICRSGPQSLAESRRLKALGHRNVAALKGGLLEWEGSGRSTFSTREEQAALALEHGSSTQDTE